MKYIMLFSTIMTLSLISCNYENTETAEIPRQDPFEIFPGDTARLFAHGLVSQGLYERDMAISPAYDELFFGVLTGNHNTIMHIKKQEDTWADPEIAPFATDSRFFYLEPAFSPDGQRLYFLSTKPMAGEDTLSGWANQNIWFVDRQEDGSWGEMSALEKTINTDGGEYFPSISNNGNLYFTYNAKDSRKSYVKKALWKEKKFSTPELLPGKVCGDGEIFNACIAPDESYLIACATGRDELSKSNPQYYVFFNLGNGEWTDAIHLGDKVNLPGSAAISPYITRDGNYLFFASSWRPEKDPQKYLIRAEDIYGNYSRPQNGLMDIYWISTDFIKNLNPVKP